MDDGSRNSPLLSFSDVHLKNVLYMVCVQPRKMR